MKLFDHLGHNCNGLSVSAFCHWVYDVACCLYFVLSFSKPNEVCRVQLNSGIWTPYLIFKIYKTTQSKKEKDLVTVRHILVHCTKKFWKGISFMPFFTFSCPGHRSSSILRSKYCSAPVPTATRPFATRPLKPWTGCPTQSISISGPTFLCSYALLSLLPSPRTIISPTLISVLLQSSAK